MTAAQALEGPRRQCAAFENNSSKVLQLPKVIERGKALATLKAKFALAGHQVYDGNNRDFIVTRWGMSRYCADLSRLAAFALQLGIKP